MYIPVASTITLVMELIIAAIIFHIIYNGYVKNIFSKKVTFFAIAYETIFNVGYMIYRTVAAPSTSNLSVALKIVAALHGILSLIILIAVFFFFLRANKEYVKNVNSFKVHHIQTKLFLFSWIVSLLSGIFLYLKINF
jgi:hypothetical protein